MSDGVVRIEFEIGQAFPAASPVARWLTSPGMAHNDLRTRTPA